MPDVSIVIPAYVETYEQFDWLCEALYSASSARMPNGWESEIVLALDCRFTPRHIRHLKQIAQGVILTNTSHDASGAGAARNVAAERATGEYLLPLDADDLLLPDSVVLLQQYAQGDRMVYGDVELIGDKVGIHTFPDWSLDSLLALTGIMPVTALHTKKAWKQAGGWDEGLSALEDVDYALRLANIGLQGYHIDQVTLKYRKHANSRQAQAEQDRTRLQEIRQYIRGKTKSLYNRGQMGNQPPCKTCPGQGGQGFSFMDQPAGIGPNTLTLRYTGTMQGAFTVRSWNVIGPDKRPVEYIVQGRGSTFVIDARDRGQFESQFVNGHLVYLFLDSEAPVPPVSLHLQRPHNQLPDLVEMNVQDAGKVIKGISDIPDLHVLMAEEKENNDRKTIKTAIAERIQELERDFPVAGHDG